MKFSFGFALFALPLLVAATPMVERAGASALSDTCNSGSVKCCNSVKKASTSEVNSLFGLLGVLLQGPVTGDLGINCSPLSVVGVGQTKCTQQVACCNGKSYNNNFIVLDTGCSPISAL